MLRWRLLSAALIISGLLTLMYLDYHAAAPGIWLSPLVVFLSALGAAELLPLLAHGKHHPAKWVAILGTAGVTLSACNPLFWSARGLPYPADCPLGDKGWPMIVFACVVFTAFLREMKRFREPGHAIVDLSLTVFCVAYLGISLSFVCFLRFFYDSQWGMTALISLLWVTKMSDTCAYFTGRTLGRNKMSPILSPKKTYEGGLGGLLGAGLASLAFAVWVLPWLVDSPEQRGPLWAWFVYGIVLAAAGMVGDLSESLLKRDSQIKDSSSWLPGLGGVLDILDSVLASSIPAFLFWAAGLIGPAS